MKSKKSSHFSVEDIIRNEFKKPLSRGTIGKDANGLLWAYGVVMKDSRYHVEVITIDLETHKTERIKDKESSYEQRADATAYITGLIKGILQIKIPSIHDISSKIFLTTISNGTTMESTEVNALEWVKP